ncbi:hypothetical protein [Candidatus Villigracilis proximus]|uniref:hypothetical protein n=1 Tax=Candidatus Villigracilis proximus TaxID=3140683 RepID=UPI0031EC9941
MDVFDALTSDRPYRAAWPREEVYRYIQEQAGQHFDPQDCKRYSSKPGDTNCNNIHCLTKQRPSCDEGHCVCLSRLSWQ